MNNEKEERDEENSDKMNVEVDTTMEEAGRKGRAMRARRTTR